MLMHNLLWALSIPASVVAAFLVIAFEETF